MTHRWDSLAGRCVHCHLDYETVWRDTRLTECQPDIVVGLRPRPRSEAVTAYTVPAVVVEDWRPEEPA